MIIPINERHRINSDAHQWIIQRYRGLDKKTGEDRWESYKYYSTLESLVNNLYDLELRLSDAEGLDNALKVAQNTANTLSQALTPKFKVLLTKDNRDNPVFSPVLPE